MKPRLIFVLAIISTVLLFDQGTKVWIKLHMTLGESFDVFGWKWFQIYFTENLGMAFGIEFGNGWGKLLLSLFRIIAVSAIGYAIYGLIKRKASYLVLCSIALIFAGAFGNIIDSAVYGLIFSESTGMRVATFMPEQGGYAGFLRGEVVDMLYFPLIDTTLPEWLPIWGGKPFRFFQAIFNIADAAICIGVAIVLIFHKRFFANEEENPETSKTTDTPTETAVS